MDLRLSFPAHLRRRKASPPTSSSPLSGSEKEVNVEKADVNFFNAQIKSSGVISNLPAAPTVRYKLKSNDIELKQWVELVPMLKEYELGGKANLSFDVSGQADKASYQGKINVEGLTAKAPKLEGSASHRRLDRTRDGPDREHVDHDEGARKRAQGHGKGRFVQGAADFGRRHIDWNGSRSADRFRRPLRRNPLRLSSWFTPRSRKPLRKLRLILMRCWNLFARTKCSRRWLRT